MRALEPAERELLDWFLERDTAWARAAREALRDTEVVGACGCGCGTLQLSVDPEAAAVGLPQPLPLEGLAPAAGGGVVNVQLYVEPARALLELVWAPEPPQPVALPRAGELEIAPWSRGSPLVAGSGSSAA